MKAALAIVAFLIFALSAQANVKARHHAKTNPMVQGVGIGLAHMLDSLAPRYPDTLAIPPYGWPLGTQRHPFDFKDYP